MCTVRNGPVHLRIVTDDYIVFQVGLGRRYAELHEANLCILDAGGAPCSFGGFVVKDCAADHGTVVHSASQLADYLDVLQVQAAQEKQPSSPDLTW